MLATLNLQISTLDSGAKTSALQGTQPVGGTDEPAGFAALFHLRVADAGYVGANSGDALPPGGNALPLLEPDVEIVVDGVALDAVSDGGTPVLSVVDEQLWQSLVSPPELETGEAALAAALQVPTIAENALPSRLNPAATVDAAPSPQPAQGLPSATQPRLEPLPIVPSEVTGVALADAGDSRPAPGMHTVIPREVQAREVSGTQPQSALQEDGQPVVQDAAVRATATPLTQPGSAVDEGFEPLRPVVQAGIAQATPTPTLQPAALANLATGPADFRAETAFATALQQQAAELIETPVRDATWGDRVGERVVMMANNQLKTAEIRLTPAELGPVRIQVNVEDGAANVTFQAQHAMTREAIEQALPRLREMFAESGLSLGQTSVGEQNAAGNRDSNARGEARATGQGDELSAADDTRAEDERPARRHEGLLDTFV